MDANDEEERKLPAGAYRGAGLPARGCFSQSYSFRLPDAGAEFGVVVVVAGRLKQIPQRRNRFRASVEGELGRHRRPVSTLRVPSIWSRKVAASLIPYPPSINSTPSMRPLPNILSTLK